MWCTFVIWSLLVFFSIETEGASKNDTGLLISRYAKVSHYNAERKDGIQTERISGGNVPLNHRSEVSGREINHNAPKVAYHYPVYSKLASKVDYGKVEIIPGVGEVIQNRFQAKPYFDYGKIPPKNEDSATYAPAKPLPAPPVRQAPPPPASGSSFPAVFNVPSGTVNPPVDLYTSPYNSYNPPPLQPDTSKDSFPPSDTYVVPAADSYAAPPDSYAAPPPSDQRGPYDYKPKQQIISPTFGPPLAVSEGTDPHSKLMDQKVIDAPPSDHKDEDDGPPDYPPRSEDDVYYPPGVPHSDVPHPPDHGDDMMDHAPMDVMPSSGMTKQQPDMMMDQGKDVGDLTPPVSDDGGHFPQYLYDSGHYDHHIYEEISHTTTPAPVKEDKRVSTTNYSYYYLGRKLWYIPLYFSIYFMIYVTILILKAIARHKVEFKNNWVEANSRSGRAMPFSQIETVDDVHRNVSNGIEKVSESYVPMAMK